MISNKPKQTSICEYDVTEHYCGRFIACWCTHPKVSKGKPVAIWRQDFQRCPDKRKEPPREPGSVADKDTKPSLF